MQYSLIHSAIIVQPNYRLLPEARGLDIMEDLSDFWKWVHADLQLFFSECKTKDNLEVDESRILVYGDSAGRCI